MEYRRLGNSGLEVSAIIFGAWAIGGWAWGGTDKTQAVAAIHQALDSGIDTFDTAPVYGFGMSEEILGEALKGKRNKVKILTKYGLRWDTNEGRLYFDATGNDGNLLHVHRFASKESIMRECERSLSRLKTDYFDLYQIHWTDVTTPIEETMEAVNRLIEQGKVRASGVCNYSAAECETANSFTTLASNQVPYSMVRREIEAEVVPFCLTHNIGILAYSPLQRGILTGKIKPGHKFSDGDNRGDQPYYQPENHRRIMDFLSAIKPLADDNGMTLAQLVLNWTIRQPGITAALAGARNPKQSGENAAAADKKLGDDEIAFINQKQSELRLDI
ncbi:MAG: aldo/keto reductase [Spirochaetales bacterium]|nr:aldo/keto reductase [Spirochaetales bacterium]